jgi:hypothetical protein
MLSVSDERLLVHLREIEETAEEVLSDKQEIVDLDRKRCENREAIRALISNGTEEVRPKSAGTGEVVKAQQCWLAMGNCFFKLPKDKAKDLLNKGEQQF